VSSSVGAIEPPPPQRIADDVARALHEDIGSGDATADLLPAGGRMSARVICRESAVIAGRAWFDACFHTLDAAVRIHWSVRDGQHVSSDALLCEIEAPARTLVTAERCALNFLQLLSGTATITAQFVAAVSGTRARILDTRKTIPGLRIAQKYAVRCGGGVNHRFGLHDAMMIKENHIAAAGSIEAATRRARELHPQLPLICEVEDLRELEQALQAGVDRILIDDFDPATMRAAVDLAGGRIPLEASGGVSLQTVRAIAETGVDYISVGSLTKHVRAVDLSMRVLG
jgi:nicotinate-nucleotide pyrophosphorylase (carboxylating)